MSDGPAASTAKAKGSLMDKIVNFIGGAILIVVLIVGAMYIISLLMRDMGISVPAQRGRGASSFIGGDPPEGYVWSPQTRFCSDRGEKSVRRISDGKLRCWKAP